MVVGRHVGDAEQLLDRRFAREHVPSPLYQSDRIPLARAASAILSAGAPAPMRRSISGFIVSTSTMLNRPR